MEIQDILRRFERLRHYAHLSVIAHDLQKTPLTEAVRQQAELAQLEEDERTVVLAVAIDLQRLAENNFSLAAATGMAFLPVLMRSDAIYVYQLATFFGIITPQQAQQLMSTVDPEMDNPNPLLSGCSSLAELLTCESVYHHTVRTIALRRLEKESHAVTGDL